MDSHNLKFDRLALELNGPNLEIHSNGGDVTLRVCVIRETEQQARLRRENAQFKLLEYGADKDHSGC